MQSLIDADIVCYRCAASANDDTLDVACLRADNMMQEIIETTESSSYKGFISGANNFRFQIYPEYKANRRDMVRPVHLQPVQEFLIQEWRCKVTNGYEADDALGMEQGGDTIICSIDKDLRQIPGKHYNIVTKQQEVVTELGGKFNFYLQLILGDRSDNIMGYDGKARQTIPKFLQNDVDLLYNCSSEQEMFNHVYWMYQTADNPYVERTGSLLYILRNENDKWNFQQLKQEMEQMQSCIQQTQEGLDLFTVPTSLN